MQNTVNIIFSLPLGKLTKINEALDATFLRQLIQQIPVIGKEADNYFLINNSLTLNNEYNLPHITIYNNFVQHSQLKGQLLQFIKNEQQQNQTSQES